MGAKGNEKRFELFEDALEYLGQLKVAQWRRPNDNGNWGIVSALEWRDFEAIEQ